MRVRQFIVNEARQRRVEAYRVFRRAVAGGNADLIFECALELGRLMREEAAVYYAARRPCSVMIH